MSERFIIKSCRAVLEDRVEENATIEIAEGVIRKVLGPAEETSLEGCSVFDAAGQIVGPGFVDPHCHGDGIMRIFEDPNRVVASLLRGGTTTVLATLGYPDMVRDGIGGQLSRFAGALEGSAREVVAGIHLEGPYVNRKYGAQTSRGVIKDCDLEEYRALLRDHRESIRWWTCAPELPGALDFIEYASCRGVVMAAGHTEATPEQVRAGIERGLKVITHWTNATGNPVAAAYAGTRRPGIDEAALVYDELAVEIIPDERGLHVHPLMARLLLKAKGRDRVLVITDAGYGRSDDPLDPSTSGLDVSIDGDGNLAGSRLSMAKAAANFHGFVQCPLPDLFRMTSLNTARLIGRSGEVGSIEPGKVANLVVLDDRLRVTATFLRGQRMVDGKAACN